MFCSALKIANYLYCSITQQLFPLIDRVLLLEWLCKQYEKHSLNENYPIVLAPSLSFRQQPNVPLELPSQ